ncbi:MAG: ATP-binding cassette domain-containing protein [Proteobacteria bacterium]|nr:ATP-binding cassette domain-containing protein [Pseudomonadota bacterium]
MADQPLDTTSGQVADRIAAGKGPLSNAPREWLARLASAGRLARAALGQVLITPAKLSGHVFVVLEGRVRLLGVRAGDPHPELLQTLGPGGIAGLATFASGAAVEAATAALDCVCLMIETARFRELLSEAPELQKSLEATVTPAELFNLLSMDFMRCALDISKVPDLVRAALPEAVLEIGNADDRDGFTFWIAEGTGRGTRWTTADGPLRRIGIPSEVLERSEIPDVPKEAGIPAPAALPPAESLLDPLIEYPVLTTQNGPLEEVIACFGMLAKFFEKEFPKEAARRVLSNEVPADRKPSLHTCGNIASMSGFAAQLVKLPSANLGRVETPALLMLDGMVSVLFQTGAKGVVLADPRTGLQRLSVDDFLSRLPAEVELLLLRPLPKEEKGKFGFKWFLPAIRKHKRVLIEVFVASFFIQLLGLANPLLTQVIIDKVLVQNSIDTLNVLGVLFVLIAIATVALTAVRRIMDHLYKLTLGYFQRRPVGEVSSRLHELENIREFLTGTALTVGLDAIFSVVYMAIMFFYDVKLAIVALLVVPFMTGVTLLGAPILQAQIRRRSEEGAKSQSHLIETLTGVQTLKAGNIEQPSRWEWQKRYAGFVSAGFHAVLTATAMNSATTLLNRLGDLSVLWYGAVLVIKGDLTLGQLIAFRIIAGYVTTPLMRLAQSWQNFQEVALSVERLGDVIDSPQEQKSDEANNIPMPAITGKVEFDSITFAYIPGQQPQLRNVSFEIPAGSFVGVVGKSGSGKSTVLKLIPRLYNPDAGRILVDDYEIAKVELYSLRRQIGTVLQDSLLFNSSVFSNIAIGDPDASPDDIMRAARVAGAHDFIMSLPQGYNTQVGEQGRALSGGQRQRIAIARTVLQRPRLLILDEATSALDSVSENLVCRNLAKEFQGKTVFFVTHRVRSVQHADIIFVFDRGILIERGRHDDLMQLKGHYQSLYTGGRTDE